jgi:dUTP pyrophosphatase
VIINFKRLNTGAKIPVKAHPGDAGVDLVATDMTINISGVYTYNTGLAVEIPEGHVGLLFPRSSIERKNMILTNSVGVIDSQYRGELMFKFRKLDNTLSERYSIGDRLGQLVIVPYVDIESVEVNELSSTERGTGGFGSSGL